MDFLNKCLTSFFCLFNLGHSYREGTQQFFHFLVIQRTKALPRQKILPSFWEKRDFETREQKLNLNNKRVRFIILTDNKGSQHKAW